MNAQKLVADAVEIWFRWRSARNGLAFNAWLREVRHGNRLHRQAVCMPTTCLYNSPESRPWQEAWDMRHPADARGADWLKRFARLHRMFVGSFGDARPGR